MVVGSMPSAVVDGSSQARAWGRRTGRVLAVGGLVLLLVGVVRLAAAAVALPAEPADIAVAVAALLLGARVVAYVPGNAVGWLFLAIGVFASLTVFSASTDDVLALVWVRHWSWWAWVALLSPLLLLFPDGRPVSRRWRPLVVLAFAGVATSVVGLAAATAADPRGYFRDQNPQGGDPAGVGTIIWAVGAGLVALAAVAALPGLVVRARRANGRQRRALIVAAAAAALFIAANVADFAGLPWTWVAATLAIPAAATVAIVRYGLYDIDLLVHRTLLYGSLTVVSIAVYVAVVTAAALVVPAGAALVAAVAVAVILQPARGVVQRGIDRSVYGLSRNPYEVMSEIGRQMEGHLPAGEALQDVVATIGTALKVPHVAILAPDGSTPVADWGTPSPLRTHRTFPLTFRGEAVGTLVVSVRSPDEHLTRPEVRALTDLARQAGVAVHALRLTSELQRARERLVLSREEERRRLRRNLHDGVGPTLAGMTMMVGAARSLLTGGDPVGGARLLAAVERDLARCTVDVREVVRGLRPPALDDAGLVAAVRDETTRFPALAVTVAAEPEDLGILPAAVEVAALRIAIEAVTNAARHGHARTCTVTVRRRDADLLVEVADDGVGISSQTHWGVGSHTMRERAAELGGDCSIQQRPDGGTLVRARLPLPTDDNSAAGTGDKGLSL